MLFSNTLLQCFSLNSYNINDNKLFNNQTACLACASWESMNPISTVNTFTPRLHEVAGPWLSTKRGSKEERAPEKVLCAGFEGPKAVACQKLWF